MTGRQTAMQGEGRARRAGIWLLVLSGLFLLGCLLSRGSDGGDESVAIILAQNIAHDGLAATLSTTHQVVFLHRLFWIVEKLLLNGFYEIVLPKTIYGVPLIHGALITLDGPLFMLAASAGGVLLLRGRNYAAGIAILAVAGILVASSGISFFAGGTIEGMMCLLVVAVAFLLGDGRPLPARNVVLLILAGAALVFSKPYAILFLLPLALLLENPRQRNIFAAAMLSVTAAWILMLFLLGHGQETGGVQFYEDIFSVKSLAAYAGRMVAFFLSMPFGLVWCFPLLPIAFLSWKVRRKSLILKSIAIVLVGAFLATLAFWHGSGAVAGPRYIVPFLPIFLEEMACGLLVLRRRWRWALLAVPLLALFFAPSLDYRNGLVSRWTNASNRAIPWAHADVAIHPAVFAWRVLDAKARGAPDFRVSADMPYILPTQAIFPMSGITRVIYVLADDGNQWDPRLGAVRAWLIRHHMGNILLWKILRLTLVLAVFLALAGVALASILRFPIRD